MKPLPIEQLRPHQIEPSKRLLDIAAAGRCALDGSDTGTGKTYVAAAVAAALDRGTLAVVPKISQTAWARVGEALGAEYDVIGWEKLRTGKTPFGWWDHPYVLRTYLKCTRCFEVVTTQECRNQFHGIHCVEVHKVRHNYGKFNWHPGVEFVIFDEVHRANAADQSLNSEMLIGAKRQGIPVLGLSATPASSPLHFRALGYMLDLHALKGVNSYQRWSRRYGCRPHPQFKGWAWMVGEEKQKGIMENIHRQVFPASGVRVRTSEIPGFPKRIVEASLFDLEGSGRINALYEEMRDAIQELHDVKEGDVDPENPLTQLLRVRQEIELLKVPVVVELVGDYLAQGKSVAVFVNFRQTIEELSKRLKCKDIIDGTVVGKARQGVIDSFQADTIHCVLVNSKAGGISVGLHDVLGNRSRVGLVMPDVSAVVVRQVFGRLPRDGGKSTAFYRMILAANTKEEDIYKKVSVKSNNIDALLDSDLLPDDCIL
jgi:superfamily II DNA or RNA helicase